MLLATGLIAGEEMTMTGQTLAGGNGILQVAQAGSVQPSEKNGRRGNEQRGQMGRKIAQYQSLLQEAKSRHLDTSEAERLNRLSFEAARNGQPDEAARLLNQAAGKLESLVGHKAESVSERPPSGRAVTVSGSPPAESKAVSAETPVFLMPFSHHYNGPGGYYAPAAEVREMGGFFHAQGIPGTLFFDGILVERLQQEDPGLIAQIRQWNLPLGYHGEETHGPYPVASELLGEIYVLKEAQGYKGQWSLTTGQDWDAAVRLVEERYSHARPYRINETTRMLERIQPSATDKTRIGGLKLVQQAFGKDVCMMPSHALESAPEGFAFRRMSRFQFDQPAVPLALHALRIFRIGAAADRVMRIAGENESIFWFMGRIMSKGDEAGEAGWHFAALRHSLESLDRSRPRLLLVGFSRVDQSEAARTIQYLNGTFFPANPGSGWVSGETLMDKFEPEKPQALSLAEVGAMAQAVVSGWKARPPDMVVTSDRTWSLCDAFDALARTLVEWRRTGKLPGAVAINALYGPVMENDESRQTVPASIDAAAVAQVAEQAICAMEAGGSDRFVPASIAAGNVRLNCAELLFAMAVTVASRTGNDLDANYRVTVPLSRAFPPYADVLQDVFKPRATQPLCYTKGQLWTVKPVRLKGAAEKAIATPSSSGASQSNERMESEKTGKIRVVFAANLDSDQPCHRDAPAGADLYQADYDLSTGLASGLKRLTSRPGQAEWFPALSPDGSYVAYDQGESAQGRRSAHSLRLIDLRTGRDRELVRNARCAAFAQDGSTFFFSTQERGGHALWNTTFLNGAVDEHYRRITDDTTAGWILVEDPAPLPNMSGVVFHYKADDRHGAGVAVVNMDGSGLRNLTPQDGCGHASVSPAGNTILCTRSRDGAIVRVCRRDGVWQAPDVLSLSTAARDYVKMDPRFADVAQARHSYVEWVGPDLVLVTTHGANGDKPFLFARLFLLRLRGDGLSPEISDLSSAIEKAAGKTGRDFCSADALLIE